MLEFLRRIGLTKHRNTVRSTASIMEYADDIAYAVHDIEDIVVRRLVDTDCIINKLRPVFSNCGVIRSAGNSISMDELKRDLPSAMPVLKALTGKLVNFFVNASK